MRGWAGIALLATIVALALLGTVWTPYDIAALDISARLQPASLAHPLGTDHLGRDLVSLVLAGAGPSLGVAALAVLIGLVVGVPLGLLAAMRPGWVEEAVARVSDVLFAFPALILAMLVIAVAGPGAVNAALAIGLFNIPVFARVTLAAARSVRGRDFVAAARLAGAGDLRIARVHVLPNIAGTVLVQATVQLSLGLIAEAGLSFLGLGAQPPVASWGRMMADAQTLVADTPRLVIVPGLAIVLTVLAINAAGEDLRQALMRGRDT
jgi:peptide/nickel transport system permease protein